MIHWGTSAEDRALIKQIVDRAMRIVKEESLPIGRQDLEMDITACHLNGTPLDLHGLLADQTGSFGHDVFGIHRHIDRETGKLQDFFLPRWARGQ